MKNRITVEHNGKVFNAIPHDPFDISVCWRCDLADDCFGQVTCLCSDLVGLNYYFNKISDVQNHL